MSILQFAEERIFIFGRKNIEHFILKYRYFINIVNQFRKSLKMFSWMNYERFEGFSVWHRIFFIEKILASEKIPDFR